MVNTILNGYTQDTPLNEWVQSHITKDDKGSEIRFCGKYFYKIGERLYCLDLHYQNNIRTKYIFCRLFTNFNTGELYYEDIFENEYKFLVERHFRPSEMRLICELYIHHHSQDVEERVKRLENGRRRLTDAEWAELKISSFETPAEYWPWTMIDECGVKYKEKRFELTIQPCPDCGTPIVKSMFCTSSESWKNLAGRIGWIFFCPKCKKQWQEDIIAMN